MFWENDTLLKVKPRLWRKKQLLDFAIIMLLAITVIFSVSGAHAVSTKSQIVDNASILTEYQLDTISVELSTLQDIEMTIVINDVGNRCTDDYAYVTAKSLYQSTYLDSEDAIVIAYCSALEGYKIGIYYNGTTDINTRKLKSEIVSAYNLYSTDSAWMEGSAISCIRSVRNIVSPSTEATVEPAPTTPKEEKESGTRDSFWAKYGKYQLIVSILGIVFVAGIITAIAVYRKHRKQIDKDIEYWFK